MQIQWSLLTGSHQIHPNRGTTEESHWLTSHRKEMQQKAAMGAKNQNMGTGNKQVSASKITEKTISLTTRGGGEKKRKKLWKRKRGGPQKTSSRFNYTSRHTSSGQGQGEETLLEKSGCRVKYPWAKGGGPAFLLIEGQGGGMMDEGENLREYRRTKGDFYRRPALLEGLERKRGEGKKEKKIRSLERKKEKGNLGGRGKLPPPTPGTAGPQIFGDQTKRVGCTPK